MIWGSSGLHFNKNGGLFLWMYKTRGMKLNSHLSLVQRALMCGTMGLIFTSWSKGTTVPLNIDTRLLINSINTCTQVRVFECISFVSIFLAWSVSVIIFSFDPNTSMNQKCKVAIFGLWCCWRNVISPLMSSWNTIRCKIWIFAKTFFIPQHIIITSVLLYKSVHWAFRGPFVT